MRLPLATILIAASTTPALPADDYFVYIGCYTNTNKAKGVQLFRFDSKSGKLTADGLAGEAVNPSWVATHPNGKYLYTVSEAGKGGVVTAFAIDKSTGRLTQINSTSSKGAGPCHVRPDNTGRILMVANYGSGSAAAIPIREDGGVGEATWFQQFTGSGPNPKRQSAPHAHSATFSPDNRLAVVADLGTDKLMLFRVSPEKGTVEPNNPPTFSTPAGSGPRHFAFHPNGKFAYAINELGSTVTAISWDRQSGAFRELQTISTLPAGFSGDNYPAEVQVHPSGRFLYGSNRGHDSIVAFSIAGDGTLKLAGHTPTQGKWPRNFGIDPSGKWLIAANQNTDDLVVFQVDGKTGKLSPTGQKLSAGAPVCVRFLPIR